ncbi:DEAD/DEAH box helicase [bacterium]|nr:DEAD/DEAH box helicase [bacterium]
MDNILDTEIILDFHTSKPPEFSGDLDAVSRFYDVEICTIQLKKVQDTLCELDFSFNSALKRTGVSSWKFNFSNNTISSRRFQNLIPLLFKSKKTDGILYKYQKEGVKFLLSHDQCILADDMGLGKTLQVIKAVEQDAFQKKTPLFLIFCPISLIENWKTEIKKWAPLFVVNEYFPKTAKSQISNSNFLIIAYSRMQNFFSEIEYREIIKSISIFDEAHKLRNESAKVNKIATKIKSSKKWLLTGTPLERDSKDIENIITLIDPSISVANFSKDPFLLKSRFTNITLRRTKTEVLGHLPPLKHKVHYLPLLDQQMIEYDLLVKKQKLLPRKERIGALTNMLMIASASDTGQSNKVKKAIELAKLQIEKNNKVIIFSRFNKILDLMCKSLSINNFHHEKINGEIDKDERERRLNSFKSSKETNVLVLNIAIGSEGLNLTEANVVIFLNEWWNPSTNRQAEDRVNRIGQHKDVEIHILRSLKTIDINLEKILTNKNILEKEYLDLLLEDLS